MSDTSDVRISLPPSTVLQGKKGKYSVINIICISERSVTVSCRDERGDKWRLKLYNGDSSISEETQQAIMSDQLQGVVLPYDIGDYSGRRFSVVPELKTTSTDQFPISIQVLVNKLIPQIAYVIDHYHKRGILLRDICPEHILYKPDEEKIAYCGFNNVALLQGKATITKAPGYGQHYSYLAPEIEKYGYSTCSDYFSLGVTILTILKGTNPIAGVSRNDFLDRLSKGVVPGINIQHLKNTSYELYSAEDKVLYLVLGLIIPDPRNRWGYGEIRCWCNDQRIPLVQKGKRIQYQFTEPCIVGMTECWNKKQLASVLASEREEWTDAALKRVILFARRNGLRCADDLDKYCADNSLSPKGKIFRCIYELDPTINGLWWDGKSYSDTGSLVSEVRKGALSIDVLSQLLKDRAISFFEKCRNRIGIGSKICISDIEELESLEAIEPGKGVQRCMMLLADDLGSRFFNVEGKEYNSLSQLFGRYKDNGEKIRELSNSILLDSSFQAWLWAKGMEKVGNEAMRYAQSNPDQSFYMLLSICERAETDENAKKLARGLFLRWGDYAPIVWMCNNIRYYSVADSSYQMLYDTLADVSFSVNEPLERLSNTANALVSDYQKFVGRTLSNPFVLENEQVENYDYGYIPMYESGYFCCKWRNGLEVCPAFLKSVGEAIDRQDVSIWLKKAEDEELRRLKEKALQLSAYVYDNEDMEKGSKFVSVCNKNMGFSVFMLVVALILLMLTNHYSLIMGVIAFVAGVMFPIYSFMWYCKKKARIGIWLRNQQDIQSKRSLIDESIRRVHERSNAICRGILNRQIIKCRTADKAIVVSGLNLGDQENLDFGTGKKVMAYISTYGYVMMATIYLDSAYSSFALASIYAVIYGIVAPFLLNRRRFANSCFAWSLTTLIVTFASILGGVVIGSL